jgi:hypothetical protein
MEAAWLVDKTFQDGRMFVMPFGQMARVSRLWFWTMPYLKIESTQSSDDAFYLPWFLRGKRHFMQAVLTRVGPSHPLGQWCAPVVSDSKETSKIPQKTTGDSV